MGSLVGLNTMLIAAPGFSSRETPVDTGLACIAVSSILRANGPLLLTVAQTHAMPTKLSLTPT